MFFLDMKSPGVEVRPIKQVNGQSGFNEVYFTDVRIPDSQRLGAGGPGLGGVADDADERAPVDRLGHVDRLPGALRLLHEARNGGRPGDRQSGCALEARDLRGHATSGLKYTACGRSPRSPRARRPGPENSIGKLVAGATMQELAMFALDLQGEAGAF